MSEKLKIVYRPLQELSPYAHNARTHSPEQVAQLVESIKQFGWTNPVLIDEKGEIIAGHGRVMAAEMLKMDSVPVIVLSGLTDEQKKEAGKEEYPTAEELPAAIAYGKLKTLMNIREMPDTSAEVVTIYKKNTLIEIVEFCAGWLKIKCPEATSGLAYVLNSADTYAFTASKIYKVVPGDNLWKIAEKELGDGSRCADIRALNGLTSNAIRVGMKLLIP